MKDVPVVRTILLGFGSNLPGPWGRPRESLIRALSELEAVGIEIMRVSHLYETAPVGSGRQPAYLNAVAVARGGMAPARLLHLLKQTERRAGRKATPPMQPRPLDIDILDFGGRRVNRPPVRRERSYLHLILPHPELHRRAFVLVPLLEVAPHWTHPVKDRHPKALLARLGPGAVRGVRRLGPLRPPA